MTAKRFKEFPLLLARAAVRECGVPDKQIDLLRWDLADGAVPNGRLGAVKGKRKYLYRKVDVAAITGLRME